MPNNPAIPVMPKTTTAGMSLGANDISHDPSYSSCAGACIHARRSGCQPSQSELEDRVLGIRFILKPRSLPGVLHEVVRSIRFAIRGHLTNFRSACWWN